MRIKGVAFKYLFVFLTVFFSTVFISCSEATMEEDAQRAAELTSVSNRYSRDNDFKEAGRTYAEVQEIMAKYKKKEKFDEFYMIYISHLENTSYSFDEGDDIAPQ